MKIPELVIDKESCNMYYIYLFCIEEKWWAFGYSAYYLSIMYPELEVVEEISPEHEGYIPCVHVPESHLVKLSDFYDTLISDEYIQISVPPTTYCRRKAYNQWREKLMSTNTNFLY